MSADSPRRSSVCNARAMVAVPMIVPPQVVSDRSILDSAIGFINEVTLAHQPPLDPKDTIIWARFETSADISDPRFGEDWELEGNVAPPLLLILGYGLGVQVWAIPANGEAVEVLSWRHGIVSALKILPTPAPVEAVEKNGRADEPIDAYGEKRPLIALVDGCPTSGSQPHFCAVNFISLKTGSQIKTIKFKNPVIDILANRTSVAVTFNERIAIFDARTLEDRLSITTCYPSPGINPNPIALGSRWLAYAENKLLHTKRSGGGCDGDGVTSYTATVLNASKSLVKGLRELGEQVAAGLTGTSASSGISKNTSIDSACGTDIKQPGIVTIIDIKNPLRDNTPTASGLSSSSNQGAANDAIIAHFIAHLEAIVAMEFDNSGMVLVTADRRGHDFHVFRIQPNPIGSSLAAVHHLYILHRGDTSAKVQNFAFTLDSRWVAVSTLRGTTHVFPITPYGGTIGVRTHSSLHVVNKLSRFHRSAGLSAEGRSNSPISHSDSTTFTHSLQPYHNSTLPPFPRPTIVMPLAQLRQPFVLGSPPGSANLACVKSATGNSGSNSQRQRLSSLSDDSGKPLSVCAIFAKSRSWLLDPPNVTREAPHRIQRKAVDSLFVMAGHGALIQYDLDTKLASNIAKEKICDDTPIELDVEAKAQWNLGRRKEGSQEIMPPLSPNNWLMKNRNSCMLTDSTRQFDDMDDRSESWLSQVEIITHAGPHRRLWMGPQFVFKTYNTPSGCNLSHVDIEAVEIGTSKSSTTVASEKLDHSNPLNMPLTTSNRSSAVPVLIESGSYSSVEQSPKLMDRFRHEHLDSDFSLAHGDTRLKEDLADAMRESPSATVSLKDSGDHGCENAGSSDNVAFYDALTAEDDQIYNYSRSASAVTLANMLPNIHSYDNSSGHSSVDMGVKPKASIEKIVNPLGTVTTVTSCLTADVKTDILDEVVSQLAAEETIIHENCDESLFRPVVAIFCDEKTLLQEEEKQTQKNNEQYQPPEIIRSNLVVPVIAKEINDELNKRERQKTNNIKSNEVKFNERKEQCDFGDLTVIKNVAKNLQQKRFKTCNLKENICDEELHEENDSDKLISLVLTNKSQKQDNGSLVKKPNEIKKESSKKMGVTKKSLKNSGSLSKNSVNNQTVNNLTKSNEEIQKKNNNDEITISKIPLQMELKPESSKRLEINKNNITKMVDSKDKTETLITQEEHKDVQLKFSNENNIVHRTVSEKDDGLPPDTSQNQIIINNRGNEKINTNDGYNSEFNSISTNSTAPKEKLRSLKINIETNKPIDAEIITAQPTIHQLENNSIDIKLNKYETVDGINDFTNKKYESILCVNDKKNNSEEEQTDNVRLFAKNDSQLVVISSNGDEDNSSELQEIGQLKNNVESKTKIYLRNTESSILENKTSILQVNEEGKFKKQVIEIKTSKSLNSLSDEKRKYEEINLRDDFEKDRLDNKSENRENSKTKAIESKKQSEDNNDVVHLNVFQLNIIKGNENVDRNQNEDITNSKKIVIVSENIDDKKLNDNLIQDLECTNKDVHAKDLSKMKVKNEIEEDETENSTLSQTSPRKKELSKNANKKDVFVSMKISPNLGILNKENSKCKNYLKECLIKTNVEYKKDNLNFKDNSNDKNSSQNSLFFWEKTKKEKQDTQLPRSAWKNLSGAEMINNNFRKSNNELIKVSSICDIKKDNVIDKLLPEIPTPNDLVEGTTLDKFSVLDPLPTLPAFEPLELTEERKSNSGRDISLINFESPLKENSEFQRRITPTPRGFTEETLILALCGSLHYEREQGFASREISPTFSSHHSSAALEEPFIGDCKSLTEIDDPYMSMEQSSQDTNTTTTNTTNEKLSSSNSSESEELQLLSMAKKQKRKKQQELKELQQQNEKQQKQQEIDDEELLPLIAMVESQVDQITNCSEDILPAILSKCDKKHLSITSNATDSDGPMPATTSDDNTFSIPVSMTHNPHKIKTKKIEHKINLIAAIEAATSSSTSSAEESGVELGPRSSHDNDDLLTTVANSKSNSTIPLPIIASSHTTVGASKKKTKRRKR